MKRNTKELEDIFLDEIIWRLKTIENAVIKPAYNYYDLKQSLESYKSFVKTVCEIILEYIEKHDHMVKQKDNYEQLLLDRMLAAGDISVEAYTKYSPIPIEGVELLLP